jgi:pimeloyl-ACP methyl ester carboxylesterase
LFLHAGHGVDADDPLVARLAERYTVYAPSHPGFGSTDRPPHVTTVDDIAYLYLDLIEELDLRNAVLMGVSFGGWLAAELAIKGCARFSQVVLIDAVGAKFGGREDRDIAEIFGTTVDEIPALFFSNPDKGMQALGNMDFKNLPIEAVTRFVRNRESLLLFGWSPNLHNPKLSSRLHRIDVPTLVLWGEEDAVTPPAYGEKFAAAIPNATFRTVSDAGHYGYLEATDAFASEIDRFLTSNQH